MATLTSHAVLLGEGVAAVAFATVGTAGRLLIDQGVADPSFQILTGDSTLASTGAMVNLAVHGVTYPASPSTNTVPVVTGSNVVTYEAVPNAALANSAITIGAQTGLAGGGTVALGSAITLSMGTSTANTLAGYNNSGVFSDVAIGNNLSLSGGTLSATASGSVTSVYGRTGAVTAQWNDYQFNLIGGTASISQGGTGQITANAGFNALSPMTTSGDIIYGGTSGQALRLGANATATNKYLQSVSSGTPIWAQVTFSDVAGNLTTTQLPNVVNNTILANISGGVATPAADTLTSILDSTMGSTQGDIIYRGVSTWSTLAPGTAGNILTTGGAGSNPSWTSSSGVGAVSSVFGRTGAVSANWNDYQFNLIGGVASVSQGGTGLQTLSVHGVLLGFVHV